MEIWRCPNSVKGNYLQILNWFLEYQEFGLLPYGANDINDIPAWMARGFICLKEVLETAKIKAQEKALQETKRQTRKTRQSRR